MTYEINGDDLRRELNETIVAIETEHLDEDLAKLSGERNDALKVVSEQWRNVLQDDGVLRLARVWMHGDEFVDHEYVPNAAPNAYREAYELRVVWVEELGPAWRPPAP